MPLQCCIFLIHRTGAILGKNSCDSYHSNLTQNVDVHTEIHEVPFAVSPFHLSDFRTYNPTL